MKRLFLAAALWLIPAAAFAQGAIPILTINNGAQETGGNLAVIAAAQGAPISGLTLPSGGSGLLGVLSAQYARQPALNGDGGALAHVTNWPSAQAVTGTFWQTTQPVSAAALPLPSGAATAANQPALNGDGGALAHVTNFPATQAVSATSLPLPSGAATDANLTNVQSAPGSSASTAVTIQGSASAVAVPVTTTATNPSTIYSGQQTLTTSSVALPSRALVNGIVITAKSTNTGTVYVGPSGVTSSTGYALIAGQSISYAVANLSSIYIIGTNGTDVVAFTGN